MRAGDGGEGALRGALLLTRAAPRPTAHPPLLALLPIAVICPLPPLAFLSVSIKSGKMAGKVLAWGFSAKLN